MIYYLCLGANLGDPAAQIEQATLAICKIPQTKLLRASSLIISAAYGFTEQPDFYNQVLEVESEIPPRQLLALLLDIETLLGRIRKDKWGPRLIDIDILLAGDLVMDSRQNSDAEQDALPELIVPHPDYHQRLFVLQLLNELIPDKLDPVMQRSISELYYLLRNSGGKP